jgi:hypothetical protein
MAVVMGNLEIEESVNRIQNAECECGTNGAEDGIK